ncbi:hypothetical protein F511_23104 [Dorcoceras hygrometricum]|uniref:Secreted protein n=1 Tax=Dorcoceras hygrometricum TaxID=472368 RepID=A0A2Z7A613_9LAMI|nr:hypothetical protein F511_23104 [Dorcoceras hygrometricum]
MVFCRAQMIGSTILAFVINFSTAGVPPPPPKLHRVYVTVVTVSYRSPPPPVAIIGCCQCLQSVSVPMLY